MAIYRDDLIRAAMAAERIKDEQLAALAGISRTTVDAIKHGKRNAVAVTTLKAIADVLGLTLREIFTEKPKSKVIPIRQRQPDLFEEKRAA